MCRKFDSQFGQVAFVEIDPETISVVIPPLCWFKKGSCQLLVKEYTG